ncbi:MAG: hypothetical protein HOM80_05445 [Bacteroidetes bacterium]|nr:hypothetical protein [Bacteroidota bacterium]
MTTATISTANTSIQLTIEKVIVLFASLMVLTFGLNAQTIQDVLRVSVNGNGYTDEAIVRFHENATSGYDVNLDAYKMFSFNNDVPQIFTLVDETEEFAINALPSLIEETSVVLNVQVGISGTYTITVSFSDFNEDVSVMLEDTKNGNMVDFRQEMTYTSTFEVTDMTDRFVLHFVPASSVSKGTSFNTNTENTNNSTVGMNEEENSVNIYTVNNIVKVENFKGEVKVYNLRGEEVANTTSEGQVDLTVSASGYFIVAVVNNGSVNTQKVYIK